MSSTWEIEQYLARLIITIAHSERSVEKARVELASNKAFIPYSFYRRLDQKGKGYVTQDDLTDFLYSGGINHNTKEVEHIFTLCATNGATKMTYNDFLKQVLPQSDNAIKNECLDRVSKEKAELGESEQNIVDNAVLEVFSKEMGFYRQTKKARLPFTSLKDFNPSITAKIIDTGTQGFLDFKSIQSFLNRLVFSFNQQDYEAFCRRIDKSRSGKITLQDFKDGLFPSEQRISERDPSARNTGMTRSSSAYLDPSGMKNSLSNTVYQRPFRPSIGKETTFKYPRAAGGSYDSYKNNRDTNKIHRLSEASNLQRSGYLQEKPVTNLLDEFMQVGVPTAEFNKSRNSQTEGSQVVFLPKSTIEILGSKDTRGDRTGSLPEGNVLFYNPDKKAQTQLGMDLTYGNKLSKETIQLPVNPSAGDFNIFDTEEKHLRQFGSIENIHKVASVGAFSPTRRNHHRAFKSSPGRGDSPVNFRKGRFDEENDDRAENRTRRGSPLHHRAVDPVYEIYWGYNKHHNNTIVTSDPFTAYNFPYDLAKTINEPVAYDLKSSFLPDYYPPIDNEKVDVKRFKENPFRFIDHEHYFKGYYNRLRGNYYDKYFNIPQAQRQTYIYNDPDVQHYNEDMQSEIPHPIRQPVPRASSQDSRNPRYVLYKTLQQDPEFTTKRGHWPTPERRSGSSRGWLSRKVQENTENITPGKITRRRSVGISHIEDQKPNKSSYISDLALDKRPENYIDYHQANRGAPMAQINLLNRPKFQASQNKTHFSHLFPSKPS